MRFAAVAASTVGLISGGFAAFRDRTTVGFWSYCYMPPEIFREIAVTPENSSIAELFCFPGNDVLPHIAKQSNLLPAAYRFHEETFAGRERLMGNHRHEESGFVGNGAGIGGVW
jgi:hypothetical protein